MKDYLFLLSSEFGSVHWYTMIKIESSLTKFTNGKILVQIKCRRDLKKEKDLQGAGLLGWSNMGSQEGCWAFCDCHGS